jgi:hypothetical protein
MAQLKLLPAAIAEATPVVPSTEGGGVVPRRWLLYQPQQTTALVPAWMAQLCQPAATTEAVPVVPFTEAGGVALPV